MPNKTPSNTQNRAKVCLLRFQKGSDMVLARRGSIIARIWKYFFENYGPKNNYLPGAFDFSKLILTTLT